jgi:agmatine/peptidylarginine deiminase
MQGVIIRYPFGISYALIAEMAEDVEVVTIVASQSQQNYVESEYLNHGVNLDHCSFLMASSDTYWTRDYGPWFIFTGDDEQGVVDFTYNRPRPNDNAIPSAFATAQGLPLYTLPLVHTGGNYMTDGQGIAISTDLVWTENPGLSPADIDQLVLEYLGIDTYHIVPDVNNAYIKHIDCWAKYLAPDTIMIREVPTSHSQYDEIEAAVEYFQSQQNCYGNPYEIVRVFTPNNEPYTNSLILNEKVLVPITGGSWDDEALESYQTAMPGYEVLGFSGSWQSTDALHCRTKGIVDRGMLYIEHTPLSGEQQGDEGFELEATIFPYSREDLLLEETCVYWRVNEGEWQVLELESCGNYVYTATIPPQEEGDLVKYYFHAEDASGRSENHPYRGAFDPHVFIVSESGNTAPDIPIRPEGPTQGKPGHTYIYSTQTVDAENDNVYYQWNWGDGTTSEWLGPFTSGETATATHVWEEKGTYTVKVKAQDVHEKESDWSEPLSVRMPHGVRWFSVQS